MVQAHSYQINKTGIGYMSSSYTPHPSRGVWHPTNSHHDSQFRFRDSVGYVLYALGDASCPTKQNLISAETLIDFQF